MKKMQNKRETLPQPLAIPRTTISADLKQQNRMESPVPGATRASSATPSPGGPAAGGVKKKKAKKK